MVPTPLGLEKSKKIEIKLKKIKKKNIIQALFPSNRGWDRPRKRKKKVLVLNSNPTQTWLENSIKKKKHKKFQKLKNIIPAFFFLSKPGLDKPRKRKKKFSPEFRSYPTRARKLQKNSIQILKIKKHHSDIISRQTGMILAKKERQKFYSGIPSYPTRAGKFQKQKKKNSKKNFKK